MVDRLKPRILFYFFKLYLTFRLIALLNLCYQSLTDLVHFYFL